MEKEDGFTMMNKEFMEGGSVQVAELCARRDAIQIVNKLHKNLTPTVYNQETTIRVLTS